METRSVANFEVALIKAYETLAKFQNETDSSTQRPRGPGCSRKGVKVICSKTRKT